MGKTILWRVEDRIGQMILNDPPTNKMSKEFFDELSNLVVNVIPKSKIDSIVIYGEGRHFSSGADLNDLLQNIKEKTKLDQNGNIVEYPDFLIQNNKSFSFFRKLEIPVIAAIRGICLGSALELILFCDIRICGENSIFGFPESTFNLMPGCCGTQNILRFTKLSRAIELMLHGNTFTAEEALKYNIVDRIVPKKDVINIALNLGKQVKKKQEKSDGK